VRTGLCFAVAVAVAVASAAVPVPVASPAPLAGISAAGIPLAGRASAGSRVTRIAAAVRVGAGVIYRGGGDPVLAVGRRAERLQPNDRDECDEGKEQHVLDQVLPRVIAEEAPR
jgi:hypothetical protein